MTDKVNDVSAAVNSQEDQVGFEILKIFIKNVSFEAPNSPDIFREEWKPEISVQLANLSNQLNETGLTEVCLRITVTAKMGDKTAFLVEVEQSGIFNTVGFSEEQLGHMHGAFCPNILFPYARETIDSLLIKAGFPAVQLAPVNFDALYMQRLEQIQEDKSQADNKEGNA